jgi:hypothetical protein
MIYDDITQFKTYAGGAVNYSVELASLEPTMLVAARQHIVPWLTQPVWDAIVALADEETPDAAETALLDHARRVLSMLTMYEYIRIGGVQFSEAGIMRPETENMKSAYKYQETQYREYMQEHGFNALETLLQHLDDNADDWITWRDDGGRTRYRATLLHRHSDLTDITGRMVSRFTFHILRPLIADIELFALQPILGEEQLSALREAFLDDDLDADETALLGICRKVLAHFAVAEGVARMYVQVKGDRLVQADAAEQQSHHRETIAGTAAVGLLIQINSDWANRHLSYLRKYLDDNAATFPLYDTYRTAQLEAIEEATQEATDERATTIHLSGAVDRRDYRPSTAKGTVRL